MTKSKKPKIRYEYTSDLTALDAVFDFIFEKLEQKHY